MLQRSVQHSEEHVLIPIISARPLLLKVSSIYLDTTLLAVQFLQSLVLPFFTSPKASDFVLKGNDLVSSILKLIRQTHNTSSGRFQAIQLVVDAIVGSI